MSGQMTAGQLRDRVTWLRPVRTENEAGQAVVSYEAANTSFALVEATAGGAGEGDQHAQLTPQVAYKVTIRSRTVPDLAHDWRLAWLNRSLTLEVAAVLPHPNGGEWVLVACRERPASTTG